MNLNRRLATLERRFNPEPTMLTMPDGLVVSIDGPGDYLVRLLGARLTAYKVSSEQAAYLDLNLIRQCTASKEPVAGT